MITESVWSAADTTPEAIEQALRDLLVERHTANPDATLARVLNMVVVVDRQWSGEIANRLRGVGQHRASRTIVCQVDPGRTTLDATVSIASDEADGERAAQAVELVVLDVGPRHLPSLATILDPLVVTDLLTVAWSPHGHEEAGEALRRVAQVVLIDAVDDPDPADGLAAAAALAERVRVVDLAWLRSAPWRERVAALFDPPGDLRRELERIDAVTIRHEPASAAAALLLLGWLAERLGWTPSVLPAAPDGALSGLARGPEHDVRLTLEPSTLDVRGLAGLTIHTTGGVELVLDRGPGGLRAVRRDGDGAEHRWTIMGASRGEGGILGEGIRQALLRDPLYRPALLIAQALAG
jgi:glucose-6-phosphate dehydrogenase assembly protein OpcA